MTDSDPLSRKNLQAWDKLYGDTPESVWGRAPLPFIEPIVSQLFPDRGRGRVFMDAATGEGRNLRALLNFEAEVFACDGAAHAIEKIEPEVAAKVQTVVCLLEDMPYADNAFDLVTLCDAIETLPEPLPACREILRVLKPGGVLLCNIPDEDDGIAGIDMTEIEERSYLYKKQFFYHFYTPKQARAMLEQAGYATDDPQDYRWTEQAHPHFRESEHTHVSKIFTARKPAS